MHIFGVIKRRVCALWSNDLLPFSQTSQLPSIGIINASQIVKRFVMHRRSADCKCDGKAACEATCSQEPHFLLPPPKLGGLPRAQRRRARGDGGRRAQPRERSPRASPTSGAATSLRSAGSTAPRGKPAPFPSPEPGRR